MACLDHLASNIKEIVKNSKRWHTRVVFLVVFTDILSSTMLANGPTLSNNVRKHGEGKNLQEKNECAIFYNLFTISLIFDATCVWMSMSTRPPQVYP